MLADENALDSSINQSWQKDNQAWWDWCVTLADNPSELKTETLVDIPQLPDIDIPSDSELVAELYEPYDITKRQRDDFNRDGFIKLPNILSPGAVARLRQELLKLLNQNFDTNPTSARNNRFLSLEMLWLENTTIKK